MSISKRVHVITQRLQILLHRNEHNRKLKQLLCRKVRIERKLRSECKTLKRDKERCFDTKAVARELIVKTNKQSE